MIRQKMMNEQDTAEWYLAQMAKVKAAKAEASKPRPSTFRCCNQLESEGHHKECVNFQPEGETKKNRIVEHLGRVDGNLMGEKLERGSTVS